MAILAETHPLAGTGCEMEKPEKGKERNLQWKTWVFAQTTHVDTAICGLACKVVFWK